MEKMEGVQVAHSGNAPNATVYVRNLEERIKIDLLVETLRDIFESCGEIVDIVAKKSLKRKGQAFIVFDDPASAAQAVEDIQGFEVFGKPMQLAFARTPSDETVKRKGTEEEFEAHKRRRLTEKERKQAAEAKEAQNKPKRPAGAAEPQKPRPAKTGAAAIPDEYLPPNKILFLQNLPKDVDADALTAIFERFDGFQEIRAVPFKPMAFAEFDTEQQAITAKEATANMQVGAENKPMKVTFQRQ
ncbi:small nuclear ribonucleoprotein [Zopfia rhizophila CBS 207.26]|uniref:Small nuclear ribonucleoprotein n=1 Tax=Zopfia rhizophila CBS 207.26 TaxID=1314779 RepID=A0A6A6EB62_9PEZI|nr:small nuclear ribonucleoprotein [Zopfia rhizophila CBS 207.26]